MPEGSGTITAKRDGDSLDISVSGKVPQQHIIDAVYDRFNAGNGESSSKEEKENFVKSRPRGAFLSKKMFKSEGNGRYSPRSAVHREIAPYWEMRRDIGGPGWGYNVDTYFFYPIEE